MGEEVSSEQTVKNYFTLADVDKDGFVTPKELFDAVEIVNNADGQGLQADARVAIQNLAAQVDKDGDGKLTLEEVNHIKEVLTTKKLGEVLKTHIKHHEL